MRRAIVAVAAGLILALGVLAWAALDSDNNQASSETSETETLTKPRHSTQWTNTGANAVTVRAWEGCETPVAIVYGATGGIVIPAGGTQEWGWGPTECGTGYVAISHICDTGLTTTSRWAGK